MVHLKSVPFEAVTGGTCYNPGVRRRTYAVWEYTEPPWDAGDVPLLVRIAVRWGITLIAFIVAEWFVNEIAYERDRWLVDGWEARMLAAAIYVAMRAVARPILVFLTCPLQLLTLGLFMLVINAVIVILTEEVCDWFGIDFAVDGFWPAFIGALVISVVSFAISRILRRQPFGPPLR
jgi:putative membrane protein